MFEFTRLKAFAANELKVTQLTDKTFHWVEKNVGKALTFNQTIKCLTGPN